MEIKWLQKQKGKLASIIKCTPKLTEKKRRRFSTDQRVLGKMNSHVRHTRVWPDALAIDCADSTNNRRLDSLRSTETSTSQ